MIFDHCIRKGRKCQSMAYKPTGAGAPKTLPSGNVGTGHRPVRRTAAEFPSALRRIPAICGFAQPGSTHRVSLRNGQCPFPTFFLGHRVSVCIAQEKSYHFPGNNAVGNALSPRNNLAFGAIDVYNENDRLYGLVYFWR